jgi:hypothetical protein
MRWVLFGWVGHVGALRNNMNAIFLCFIFLGYRTLDLKVVCMGGVLFNCLKEIH